MHYLTSKVAYQNLYQTSFDDGYVIWTTLPWSEYKSLREAISTRGSATIATDVEEHVYNKCAVISSYDESPPDDLTDLEKWAFQQEDRNHQPAGVISTVVKSVLRFSGTDDPFLAMGDLNRYRNTIQNIEDQFVVTICRAFPAYKPEDVEKLDWQTVLKRVAQAESMLMGIHPEAPFKLDLPDKVQKAPRFDLNKELRDLGREFTPTPNDIQKEAAKDTQDHRRAQTELRMQYLRERGLG